VDVGDSEPLSVGWVVAVTVEAVALALRLSDWLSLAVTLADDDPRSLLDRVVDDVSVDVDVSVSLWVGCVVADLLSLTVRLSEWLSVTVPVPLADEDPPPLLDSVLDGEPVEVEESVSLCARCVVADPVTLTVRLSDWLSVAVAVPLAEDDPYSVPDCVADEEPDDDGDSEPLLVGCPVADPLALVVRLSD